MTATAQTTATYPDLLTADGAVNAAAFEQILASKVIAEINLRLCVAKGLFAPRSVPLGEVQAWRAACVRKFGLGPVSDAERHAITKQERARLEDWIAAWQGGAAKQRAAMRHPRFRLSCPEDFAIAAE